MSDQSVVQSGRATGGAWRSPVVGVVASIVVLAAGCGLLILIPTETPTGGRGRLGSWLSLVPARSMAVCRCEPDRTVDIRRPDGLRLTGSLDLPRDSGNHPGILLLHGNTPWGRKLPVYRVLATRLRERGFAVLSIDFGGYGESDDPFRLGTVEAVDQDLDASAALAFLETLPGVDRASLFVICHSAGCKAAFTVGLEKPSVEGIVAIGPPRRDSERLWDEADNERFWQRARQTRRLVYGTDFPAWYTRDLWLEARRRRTIEQHVATLSEPEHKPVLLLDGELESPEDRRYLREYFDRIIEPKAYLTIPRSNHYANTARALGLHFYDRGVADGMAREIVTWLSRSLPAGSMSPAAR